MFKDDYSTSPVNKRENIKRIRQYLGLTQSEFIAQYLSDEDGNPAMSVATLSNLEAKGGRKLNDVVCSMADTFSMDVSLFLLTPEVFSEKLISIIPVNNKSRNMRNCNLKRNNVNTLFYKLTMYFAEQILTGELKRGDKVPAERILSDIMGVGRYSIREAMKVLNAFGIVDIIPGQGTFISKANSEFFAIPIASTIFLSDFNVDNIIEIRNILEVTASGKSAVYMSKKDVKKLKDIVKDMEKACDEGDIDSFSEKDMEFHDLITSGSGNQIIINLQEIIMSFMSRIYRKDVLDIKHMEELVDEHREIIDKIETGDHKGAEICMKRHLEKHINMVKS